MKEISDFTLYDKIPIPIIITKKNDFILYKNATAKVVFSELRKGSSIIRYSGIRESGSFIIQKDIFGKDFYISTERISSNGEEYKAYYLIDSFFGEETKLSEMIFQNSENIFKSIEIFLSSDLGEEFTSDTKQIKFLRKNGMEVRRNQSAFLRFLKLCEFEAKAVFSCNLFSLFTAMRKKLSAKNINFDFQVPHSLGISANPEDLAYILLNVVSFIMIYSGTNDIKLEVFESNDEAIIDFTFDDTKGIVQAYNEAMDHSCQENLGGFISFTPLLCAMIIMRKYKREVIVKSENGKADIILAFKQNFSLDSEIISSTAIDKYHYIDYYIDEMLL